MEDQEGNYTHRIITIPNMLLPLVLLTIKEISAGVLSPGDPEMYTVRCGMER